MHIKSIVLDGFKSYGNRVEVNGFDPEFNAITGLNGTGKSNILDAICFVLGITNLANVRASSLQELIYKHGQAGITKATVSITFDNRNKDQSPIGLENNDEFTVTRQIVMGGKNKYLVNGLNVQNKRVIDLFCSVQLNVNNPHFLIMQGRITKVLNMKPPEILSMVEEAAGTRMYETKKQAAEKTIERKDAKLRELNEIIRESIAPKLQKLQDERAQFQEYQKVVRELENLNRLHIAYNYVTAEERTKEAETKLTQVEDEIKSKKHQIQQNETSIKEFEEQISELNKKVDEESGAALRALEAELGAAGAAEGLADDEAAAATKRRALDQVESTFESLREKHQNSTAVLADAQQKFLEVSSGLEGASESLQDQLMAAKQEASEAATRISQSAMEKKHAENRLKALEKEFASSSAQYQRDMENIGRHEAQLAELQAELSRLAGAARREAELAESVRGLARRERGRGALCVCVRGCSMCVQAELSRLAGAARREAELAESVRGLARRERGRGALCVCVRGCSMCVQAELSRLAGAARREAELAESVRGLARRERGRGALCVCVRGCSMCVQAELSRLAGAARREAELAESVRGLARRERGRGALCVCVRGCSMCVQAELSRLAGAARREAELAESVRGLARRERGRGALCVCVRGCSMCVQAELSRLAGAARREAELAESVRGLARRERGRGALCVCVRGCSMCVQAELSRLAGAARREAELAESVRGLARRERGRGALCVCVRGCSMCVQAELSRLAGAARREAELAESVRGLARRERGRGALCVCVRGCSMCVQAELSRLAGAARREAELAESVRGLARRERGRGALCVCVRGCSMCVQAELSRLAGAARREAELAESVRGLARRERGRGALCVCVRGCSMCVQAELSRLAGAARREAELAESVRGLARRERGRGALCVCVRGCSMCVQAELSRLAGAARREAELAESVRGLARRERGRGALCVCVRGCSMCVQAELSRLAGAARREAELAESVRGLARRERAARDQVDARAPRLARCKLRYSKPEPGFDDKRVYGTICRLIDVRDPIYCTALETAAGGRLFNVVVDTEVTSKLLLQRGQLEHRTTIVPLNKINGHVIDRATVELAQQIGGGPDNVQLALDLVQFPGALRPAMAWVWGSTLVCRDLDTARRVTFHPAVRRRTVTLDGDVFDPSGTLSGGARLKVRPALRGARRRAPQGTSSAPRHGVTRAITGTGARGNTGSRGQLLVQARVVTRGRTYMNVLGYRSMMTLQITNLEKANPWISSERSYFGAPGGIFDFQARQASAAAARLQQLQARRDGLARGLNARAHTLLGKEEEQYQELLHKKQIVEADRAKLVAVMAELDEKKRKTLVAACEQVNKDFGSIFSTLLPGAEAKLTPPEGQTVLDGLEVKVGFNGAWKESLGELSGGQRSLVALSLVLGMLRWQPAPLYVLDEVDAALDLAHTQNIGLMLRTHFRHSQFIIVSLKDGMFNNANVLFRTRFVDGMSSVQRTTNVPR
ncbi:structural maintenance of chromosomes protein 2-like [Spodoptera litura]|uniref:Structural maintenance of chromosomes protein n=1 Tax=Spodoptera litura TaxID=69820 RepID=A0A9J7DY89_SPOLT|nr:structural maintenance of chromosomes protein 2-like [Spodoptera litura]